jgi:hypothetical protein
VKEFRAVIKEESTKKNMLCGRIHVPCNLKATKDFEIWVRIQRAPWKQ